VNSQNEVHWPNLTSRKHNNKEEARPQTETLWKISQKTLTFKVPDLNIKAPDSNKVATHFIAFPTA
jgi:hypothetical protein